MSTRCAVRERRLRQSRARPGNFWGDFFFSNISLCLSPKRDAPFSGADLGGGCRGCAPPSPEMTCGFLIQLVFCKKKTMWFIGVEVEQEMSAPPPKKNPGSAPNFSLQF